MTDKINLENVTLSQVEYERLLKIVEEVKKLRQAKVILEHTNDHRQRYVHVPDGGRWVHDIQTEYLDETKVRNSMADLMESAAAKDREILQLKREKTTLEAQLQYCYRKRWWQVWR
jgi:hypothetical protein